MKTGIELIADERKRGIEQEGWTAEHDDLHDTGELADAGAAYAMTCRTRETHHTFAFVWPFESEWWKPTPNNRVNELAKAGALIAAEIDRLNRLDNKHNA